MADGYTRTTGKMLLDNEMNAVDLRHFLEGIYLCIQVHDDCAERSWHHQLRDACEDRLLEPHPTALGHATGRSLLL